MELAAKALTAVKYKAEKNSASSVSKSTGRSQQEDIADGQLSTSIGVCGIPNRGYYNMLYNYQLCI